MPERSAAANKPQIFDMALIRAALKIIHDITQDNNTPPKPSLLALRNLIQKILDQKTMTPREQNLIAKSFKLLLDIIQLHQSMVKRSPKDRQERYPSREAYNHMYIGLGTLMHVGNMLALAGGEPVPYSMGDIQKVLSNLKNTAWHKWD